MVLQFFQSSVAWFKSDSEVIWFLSFWSFLVILGALEIVIPAFQQPPARLHRWPTNFSLGIVNAMVLPLAPVSAVWGAKWAYDQGIGLLNQVAHPWWIAVAATLALHSLAKYLDHLLMHKVPL